MPSEAGNGTIVRWLSTPLRHRSLLAHFLRHDVGGRYVGSIGGHAWNLLTPAAQLAVYLFVFSAILNVDVTDAETGTDRFALYLLTGIVPWLAFAESLSRAPVLLLERATLITKVAFPVEVLPLVGTSAPFLLNGIALVLLLAYLAFSGYSHPGWLALPVLVALHATFTLGLVAAFSALGVFVRDFQPILGVALFAWFFLTPIVYPLSAAPAEWRALLVANPMYVFVTLYRDVLLAHRFVPSLWLWAVMLAAVSLVAGGWFFLRAKPAFADVL